MSPPAATPSAISARERLGRRLRSITRPLRHRALSAALYSASWVARHLPLRWCQGLGVALGLTSRALLPRQRALILSQLSRCDLSPHDAPHAQDDSADLKAIEREHWRDLGRRLGEWLAGERALTLFWASTETRQVLSRAYQDARSGAGLVVCTAHYGHWELMAAWLSAQGYAFLAVASSPPRGPFGLWLTQHRARLGVEVIHPLGGARQARKRLARGGVVALLIDHSTRERASLHSFLGRVAPHSHTADRLISASGAAALWVWSQRSADGRYEVGARSLTARPHPSSAESMIDLPYSLEAHRHLATLIKTSPEQWLWLHQRWRARELHDRASTSIHASDVRFATHAHSDDRENSEKIT